MVYFLSDAHLGSRAIENPHVHQEKLVAMLQSMAKDASAIYLLGDIFDFWCEYFWCDTSKGQYHPFLQTLKKITAQGIEIHFFIGNHDIWTFGWLAKETGVVIHRKPESIVMVWCQVIILSNCPRTYKKKYANLSSCAKYSTVQFAKHFSVSFHLRGVMNSDMNGQKIAV